MNIELGKEALKSGSNYVTNKMDGVNINIGFLRNYFNIDDSYVIQKLFLILFPYSKSKWDINSGTRISKPDLYIPIMSLFTYILVKSVYCGLFGDFMSEKLGLIFTRLVFLECILLAIAKCFAYFMSIQFKLFDAICYSGYKYFLILVIQLVPKNRLVKWSFCIYGYVSFFFFISRSLKNSLISEFSTDRTRKLNFLFGFAILQIIVLFFLS